MSAGRTAGVEVVCAMSLDGRITTPDRRPWRWSDPEDHDWLLSRMEAADVLVAGAGTIRSEDATMRVPAGAAARRAEAGRPPQPLRVVLSPTLSVPPAARLLAGDDPVVIAARPDAIRARGAALAGRATLVPWEDDLALAPLLAKLREWADGDRVVCLGGGRTNATFLEQDLVDRVSMTVSAFVIGAADAPGPFAGRGFPPERFPAFRLAGTHPAGRDLVLEWERDRAHDGRPPATGLDAPGRSVPVPRDRKETT